MRRLAREHVTRAREHVINDVTNSPVPPEPQSESGCRSVAMGLSRKPRGRFPLFFACKLISIQPSHLARINRIGSICGILESFS